MPSVRYTCKYMYIAKKNWIKSRCRIFDKDISAWKKYSQIFFTDRTSASSYAFWNICYILCALAISSSNWDWPRTKIKKELVSHFVKHWKWDINEISAISEPSIIGYLSENYNIKSNLRLEALDNYLVVSIPDNWFPVKMSH